METRTNSGRSTEGPGHHLNRAVADLQNAVEHSGDAIRAVKDKAAEKVSAVQDSVQGAVRDTYGAAKDKVADCVATTDAFFRDKPYRTLAIGFGAGFLLALLLRRR